MRDPIIRMYETDQQARDAVSRLRQEGFPEDAIFLVTPGFGGEPGSAQAISSAILAGRWLPSNAEVYVQGLEQGRSLLVVRAPFGHGMLATQVMDSFGPVDTGLRLPRGRSPAWDEAAPLSSALQLPILQRHQPAPFSALLGLHTISRGRSFLSQLFGELISPHFALFGRSSLSDQAAPLSSLFGLKTLYRKDGPKTSRFGLPLLSRNPAPLSSALGLSLLTGPVPLRRQAAPLSAVLGLPTLTRGRSVPFGTLTRSSFALFGRDPLIRNPAPLSSRLGLKTLSDKDGQPWTSSYGLPLLLDGAPLALGLPLVSHNPAPLSSLLGLPVLTRHQ